VKRWIPAFAGMTGEGVAGTEIKTNTASGRGATGGRVVDAVNRSRDDNGVGAECDLREESLILVQKHALLTSISQTETPNPNWWVRAGHLPLTRPTRTVAWVDRSPDF